VGVRVDGAGVRSVGEQVAAKDLKRGIAGVEDSGDAGLGEDVEASEVGVEGEHVGAVAGGEGCGNGGGVEIDLEEPGVAVAGNEGAVVGDVELQTVVVVATSKIVTLDHGAASGVDEGELVAGLDVDEDTFRGGVVGDVAGFAADVDLAARRARGGVDLGDGGSGFVGEVDGVVVGVVGQAVGGAAGRARLSSVRVVAS
jgi:hypothetical protein